MTHLIRTWLLAVALGAMPAACGGSSATNEIDSGVATSADARVGEEQSADAELAHAHESISWLAWERPGAIFGVRP